MEKVTERLKGFVKGEEALWGLYYLEWIIIVGLFVLLFVFFPYILRYLERSGLLLGALVPLIIGIIILRCLLVLCIKFRAKKIERVIEDEVRQFILRGLPNMMPELSTESVHMVYREFDTMMSARVEGKEALQAYLERLTGERRSPADQGQESGPELSED